MAAYYLYSTRNLIECLFIYISTCFIVYILGCGGEICLGVGALFWSETTLIKGVPHCTKCEGTYSPPFFKGEPAKCTGS